jgi:ABC-type antimicrobial peptide transport system permease subunit
MRETPMSWPRRVVPVYRPGTTELTPDNQALAAHVYPLSQSAGDAVLVVRSSRPPKEIAAALLNTLGRVQPNARVTLRTWPEALQQVLYPARASPVALGVLGLFGVMLAVTGIFGTAAHSVSRRARELGIRMALGAREGQVVSAAVGRRTVLLGVGCVFGCSRPCSRPACWRIGAILRCWWAPLRLWR